MDVYETHINQYNHNKNFIKFGISNTKESFHDWEITVNFYATIHLIEAILFKECHINEIRTHDERYGYIKDNVHLFNRNVQHNYFKLKTLSHTARYSGVLDVNNKDSEIAQMCLENIESELSDYIT